MSYSSCWKDKKNLERQKQLPEIEAQTVAGTILSVRLGILDINSRITEENWSARNSMLQNHFKHLLRWQHRKERVRDSIGQKKRILVRPPNHCLEMKVGMVWPCHKSEQPFHYLSTKYHLRQQMRQTEMGRVDYQQH